MKIAVQVGLLPGETMSDKAKWARDHGVDGVEMNVWNVPHDKLRRDAEQVATILPVSSVCANAEADGTPSFDFLDPDKAKRRKSIEASRAILTLCGEIGAVGQIVPPIFGAARVPDLSPFLTPLEVEDRLAVALLQELGPHAQANGVKLLLEPLNRYEQHYLKRLRDGVRVIEAADAPGVALLADLFHMHIEEPNSPQALRDAGAHVAHLHLADNTRQEPGTGDIDFVAAFRALRDIGFTGYMAYECGVTGATADEKAVSLARSLEFVQSCIARSKEK